MIYGITGSPYTSYYSRPVSRPAQGQPVRQAGGVLTAQRAAQPELPVEPVRPATPVNPNQSGNLSLSLPIREGADPVEMAVRMRIQYADPAAQAAGQKNSAGLPAAGEDAVQPLSQEDAALGAEAVQKAMEEGECQTCKERKYQDGSDDMGVSYQTPTHIDPDAAASAVQGHEMEHVVREQAKAQREDRKVVSQSVTLHSAICPECGRVYISGGTTRTTTSANNTQPQQEAAREAPKETAQGRRAPFLAVA